MVMCVMPWVMNMEVKNVVVDVVDNDRSTASQRLVHEIAANSYFIFRGQQPTYAAALQDIEQSSADIVVVIPPQFGRQLALGQTPQVLIAANAVNGTKGALGSNYLSQIVTAYAQPSAAALRNKASTLFLFNKQLNFKLFMIPALFALIVMLVTGYLPTLNIVSEKEAGTIEQINVTPVKKWEFILAKLIPYWLIAFFVITVCLTLARVVHGVTPVATWHSSTYWPCAWPCSSRRSDSSFPTTPTPCNKPFFVMWFFHDDTPFAIWFVHANTLNATLRLPFHLHKPCKLLL